MSNSKSKLSFLKTSMAIWFGLLVIIIISLSLTSSMKSVSEETWNSVAIASVFTLVAGLFGIKYWDRQFINPQDIQRKNPYRRMFFDNVNTLSIILLGIGLSGAFLLLFQDDGRNHAYEAMGLIIIIIWAVIFLRYFIWAVYHYNINYGYTDKDWDDIFQAKEEKKMGLDVDPERLKGPSHNPYRAQTFGLPPGTVRGMIALTLLFGAISMLVVSMGLNGEIQQDSFFWDHFEFYKTAFLMMIAFYFGDRSLKYLQKRWPSVQQAKLKEMQMKGDNQPDDDVAEDDRDFVIDQGLDTSFGSDVSPTSMKNILADAESTEKKDDVDLELEREYVHIKDTARKKNLDNDLIESVAHTIKTEPAALKAIIEVESSGGGFLKDGRAKILFEGHKFWYWLDQFKKDPEKLVSGNEDILYKNWTRKYYLGGTKEYDRFQKAFNIHPVAAVYAASWGLFQVLGENFNPIWGHCRDRLKSKSEFAKWETKLANSTDADEVREMNDSMNSFYLKDAKNLLDPNDFIKKQEYSEHNHLLDFVAFIGNKATTHNLTKKSTLLELIQNVKNGDYNWSAFAYGYNGSGYKQNNYHVKLQRAYEKYKKNA